MPNWCENRVSVHGEADQVKDFVALVSGGVEGKFSFQFIDPCPQEILDTPASFGNEEDKARHEEMMEKYGYAHWYDRNVNEWGTKWDVGETDYYDADDDGYVQYEFMTAWGPPEGIYFTLVEKFPDLSISWFYHEPGCELAGYLGYD